MMIHNASKSNFFFRIHLFQLFHYHLLVHRDTNRSDASPQTANTARPIAELNQTERTLKVIHTMPSKHLNGDMEAKKTHKNL